MASSLPYGVSPPGANYSPAPLSGYPSPLHGPPPPQTQQSPMQMLPFPPPVHSTPSPTVEAYQNYIQYMQTTGQTPPPLPYGPPPYPHPQQLTSSGVYASISQDPTVPSSIPPTSIIHGPNSPIGSSSLDGARLMAMLQCSASKDLAVLPVVSTSSASTADVQASAVAAGLGEGSELELSYAVASMNSGEFGSAPADISEPPAHITSQPTAPPVSLAPTPSAFDYHLLPRKGKKPSGRVLSGSHVIYDTDERLPGESQPQLEVSPITVYGSEYVLALGRQVAVNRSYIVYGLRAGHIRILNINTATRALLRGHSTRLSDMAFFADDVHLLITASVDGRVIIRTIEEVVGADGKSVINEHVVLAVRFVGPWEVANPRVVWHPHQQDHVMVSCSRFVFAIEVFQAATAIGIDKGQMPENIVECNVDHPIEGVHVLSGHAQDVTDVAIPPHIATRLASASLDGTVRIWTSQEVCVSSFTPYGGHPVSSVAFLDAPGRRDDCVLITGGPLNRELKLWVSSGPERAAEAAAGGEWRCIQTLELTSSKGPVEDAFFNQVIVVQNASLILVANAKRNAIYGVHVAFGPTRGSARMDYIAEFSVTMPILSFTASGDSVLPDSSDGTVQIFCVQTQAIQQYSLDLSQCLPQESESTNSSQIVALQVPDVESSTSDTLASLGLGQNETSDMPAASVLLGSPLQPISTETRSLQREESPPSKITEMADRADQPESPRRKEVGSLEGSLEMYESDGLSEPAVLPPDAPLTTPSAPPIAALFSSPEVVAPVAVVGGVDLAKLSVLPPATLEEETMSSSETSAPVVPHLVTPSELLGTVPASSTPAENVQVGSSQGQTEGSDELQVSDTTSSSLPGKVSVEAGGEAEKRERGAEEEAVSTSGPSDVSSFEWNTSRGNWEASGEGTEEGDNQTGLKRTGSLKDNGHVEEDALSLLNKTREGVAGKKGATGRDLPRTYPIPGLGSDKREVGGDRERRELCQVEGKEESSEGGVPMPVSAGIGVIGSPTPSSAVGAGIPHLPAPTTILPGAVSAGGVVKSRKNKNKAGGVATTASGPLINVPASPVLLPRTPVLTSTSSGGISDLVESRSTPANGSEREAGSGSEGIGAEGSGEVRITRTMSRDNLGLVGQVLAMQETMQQLLGMQKELQKQLVLAVSMPVSKEGKRIEAAIGQRLEKVLKAHSDALWARLQEESAKREEMERERTINIASTVVKTISKDLPAVFERILRKELSALGPTIANLVQPGLDTAAVTAMNDAVYRAIHERVLPGLEKIVAPKVDSLVSRQGQLQTTVRQALQDGLKANFQSSVIPALEGSCKAMFEQIDSTFQQGLAEHASLVQQHVSSSQGALASSLQESVSAASSLATTLRDEISEGQRRLVALAEQAVTAGKQNASGHSKRGGLNGVAGIPSDRVMSLEHLEQSLDPTIELSRLVAERKYEDAFTKALSLSDVSIVSWLCQQVDPAVVFALVPMPLSQRVLLSLIQQLSCDLGSNISKKLAWIREAALALNPTDPLLIPHMKPILEQVYSQVYRQAGQIPAGSELSASLRLVMHILLSLKGDFIK